MFPRLAIATSAANRAKEKSGRHAARNEQRINLAKLEFFAATAAKFSRNAHFAILTIPCSYFQLMARWSEQNNGKFPDPYAVLKINNDQLAANNNDAAAKRKQEQKKLKKKKKQAARAAAAAAAAAVAAVVAAQQIDANGNNKVGRKEITAAFARWRALLI